VVFLGSLSLIFRLCLGRFCHNVVDRLRIFEARQILSHPVNTHEDSIASVVLLAGMNAMLVELQICLRCCSLEFTFTSREQDPSCFQKSEYHLN